MEAPKKKAVLLLVVGLLAILGIAAYLLRGAFHPYHVPTGSMEPTIPAGNYLTVNDWAYRSVSQIQRGDVIVFEPPPSKYTERGEAKLVYVFRVVGLPGDTLSFDKESNFVVNEVPLEQMTRAGKTYERQADDWYQIQPGGSRQTGELTIPKGHVFVAGDNRMNALDSRYWGTVPFDLVKGRARVD